MWALSAVILAVLAVLDLTWVLLNFRFGIYKDRMVTSRRHLVPLIWIIILVAEALLLAYIVSRASRWWIALLTGLFVGFVVYFTFNGTALTVFESWTFPVAAMDTAWGMVLFGTAALVGYAFNQYTSDYDSARKHPASIYNL